MPHKFTFAIFFLIAATATFSIGMVFPIFSTLTFQQGSEFFLESVSAEKRGLWLGALLAAAPTTAFLAAPCSGFLSDWLGRKRVLLLLLAIILVGHCFSILGIWSERLPILLAGRLIGGIGATCGAVANAVVADISEPDKKARNFAWIAMAAGLGATVGPLIGGKLSASGGYIEPFIFAICVTLLNILLIAFAFKDQFQQKKETLHRTLSPFANLSLFFKQPHLKSMFLILLGLLVGWTAYWQFVSVTWIEEFQFKPNQVGNFYSYSAICYVLASGLLVQPFLGKFRPVSIFFVSLLAIGTSLLFLLAKPSVEGYWICIPIQEFFYVLFCSTAMAFFSNHVKAQQQGELMGILQSFQAFAFLASILFLAPLLGWRGDSPLLIGAFCILCSAALVLFRKHSFDTSYFDKNN